MRVASEGKPFYSHYRAALGVLFSLLLGGAAYGAPKVVTTVRPIYSLVAGLMQGVGAPHLLITGSQSPHTHTLQPSQAMLLQEADLIVWVGASLETFLPKLLEKQSAKTQIIKLLDLPFIATYRHRFADAHEHKDKGGFIEPVEINGFAQSHHVEPEKRDMRDPHIWLDPVNAETMLEAIASVLSELDPVHAPTYHANCARLVARLKSLDQKIERDLHIVRGRPYLSVHDSYQYFDRHFGTFSVGVLSLHPENLSRPEQIKTLYQLIQEKNVQCVFAETEFPSSTAPAIADRARVKMMTLDPLGADIEPLDENLYFTLIETLARSFVACLRPPST